jgi:GTP-binding protein
MGTKVLADVPGLIEGASKGKGLGVKFLKHVEKLQLLVHCVSSESADVTKDYHTVIQELAAYNPELAKKEMIILLTKADVATPKEIQAKMKQLKKLNPKIYPVSILDPKSIDALRELLTA